MLVMDLRGKDAGDLGTHGRRGGAARRRWRMLGKLVVADRREGWTQSCPVPSEHVGPFVQKAGKGAVKGTCDFPHPSLITRCQFQMQRSERLTHTRNQVIDRVYSSWLVPAFGPQAGQKRQAQPDSEKWGGGRTPFPSGNLQGGHPRAGGGEGERSQSQGPGDPCWADQDPLSLAT